MNDNFQINGDNLRKLYGIAQSKGMPDSYDDLRAYLMESEDNRRKFYDKMSALGMPDSYEDYSAYIQRVDVSDVRQAEQNQTPVAQYGEIPTMTMEQVDAPQQQVNTPGGDGHFLGNVSVGADMRPKPMENNPLRNETENGSLVGTERAAETPDFEIPTEYTQENFMKVLNRSKELTDGRKRLNAVLDSDSEFEPLTISQKQQYESRLNAIDEEMNGLGAFIDEWSKTDEARAYYDWQKQQCAALEDNINKYARNMRDQRAQRQREREESRGFWSTMANGLMAAENPITPEVVDVLTNPDENNIRAAQNEIRNAKNQLKLEEMRMNGEMKGLAFLRGMETANYYELIPAVGLADAASILSLSQDVEEGKELSETQQMLYDAMKLRAGVDFSYQDNNTVWERVGQSAPEQIAFTLQFVVGAGLTGATEVGERVAAKTAQKAAMRYAKKGVNSGARRFIGGTVMPKLEGMAVSATMQTFMNPLSLADMAEDFERRYAGDIYYDGDGNLHVFDNDRSAGQAAYQAVASAWIENFTEYAGGNITKSVRLADGKMLDLAGKFDNVMKRVGSGKIQDVFRIPRQLGHLTQIGSAPEEFLEEELGSVMNALFATDAQRGESYGDAFKRTIGQSFSGEQQLETLLSVSITSMLLGGGGNAVNAIGNAGYRRHINQDVERSKALLGKVHGIDIGELDNQIENGEISDIASYLKAQSDANRWSQDEQGAAVSYVLNRARQIGMRHSDEAAIEEAQQEMRQQAEDMANRWDGNIYNATWKDGEGNEQPVTIINGRVHYTTRENGSIHFNPYISSGMLAIRLADGTKKQVASRTITGIQSVMSVDEQLEAQGQTIPQMMKLQFEQEGMVLPTVESVWGGNLEANVTQLENGKYTYLGQDQNGLYAFANNDKKTQKDNPIVHMTERQLVEYGLSLNIQSADEEQRRQAQEDMEFMDDLDRISQATDEHQWGVVKAYAGRHLQFEDNGMVSVDTDPRAYAPYLLACSEGSFENAIASIDQSIAALVSSQGQQAQAADVSADPGFNAETHANMEHLDETTAKAIDFYTNTRNALIEMQQGQQDAKEENAANIPVSQMEVGTEFPVNIADGAVARVEGKDADGRSVVSVYDADGNIMEAGIDDWSDEFWDNVRVRPQETAGIEQNPPKIEQNSDEIERDEAKNEQQEETPLSPAQQTFNDLVQKYGDKAGHKIDVTAEDKSKTLDKAKKALEKAQTDYDDAPIGKEEKAEAALQKAQKEYETALAEQQEWDEVKSVKDRFVAEQLAARQADEERRREAAEREGGVQQDGVAGEGDQGERGATSPVPSSMEGSEPQPIGRGFFGNIYDQFKGKVKEAFDFLISHREGDLLGVFHRDGLGDIDLVWGSSERKEGLEHIIEKHINTLHDFSSIEEAVNVIDDVIKNGIVSRENPDKANLDHNGYRVSVKKQIRDDKGNVTGKKNWVVTAFDKERGVKEKERASSGGTLTTPPTNQSAGGVTLPPNEARSDGKDTQNPETKDADVGKKVTDGKDNAVDAENDVMFDAGMGYEERLNSLASETEDVAREDQIMLYDGLKGGVEAAEAQVKRKDEASDAGAPKATEMQAAAVVEQLKKTGMEGDVVTVKTTAEAKEKIRTLNAEKRRRQVEETSRQFDKELQEQIDGTQKAGHVYSLGTPSPILLSAGIPNLPIEMASARLNHKSNQENHPFELSEVKGLVEAVQNPLAVFRSATHIGSNVILTELRQGNKNFVVAIKTNKQKGKIQINDIRSIHPRTTTNVIDWINSGLMDYASVEKLTEWVDDKIKTRDYLNSSNPAEVRKPLVSAAKILQNFENPTIPDENLYHAVWHGSPHAFKAFDFSHMGSGEGAQAYGWGGYVTEVEGIGRTYAQRNISDKHKENRTINKLARETIEGSAGKEAALDYLNGLLNESWSDKKRVKAMIKIIETGKFLPEGKSNLYEVEIPDDNGTNYLHWEMPFSQQGDGVKAKIREMQKDESVYAQSTNFDVKDQSGEEFYKKLSIRLGGDKAASELLSRAGFAGISYPAEYTSGGREDGRRNYVIFNEKDMRITNHAKWALYPKGEIAGATLPDGTVILVADNMTIDTPFHEFAHKLRKYAKAHPELANLAEAIDKYAEEAPRHIKDYVKRTYRYKTESDAYMDESYAWALSMQSKGKIESFLKERGVDTGDLTELSKAQAWYKKLWDAVKRLWDGVKNYFAKDVGKEYADLSVFDAYDKMSAQEIGDKLYDLLMGGKKLPEFGNTTQDSELQNYAGQYAVEGDVDADGNVRPEALGEIRKERADIEARAKADGSWLKAPNGEATKLTPEQWVTVRTKRFKDWFGDWELKHKKVNVVSAKSNIFKNFDEAREWAKKNISRVYSDDETGGKGEIEISHSAIDKYFNSSSVEKSVNADVHKSAISMLPEIIRHSVVGEVHPDYIKKNGVRSVENGVSPNTEIHRLFGAVEIDGNVYRVKTTVKYFTDKGNNNKAHSYEVVKIELMDESTSSELNPDSQTVSPIQTANLLKGIEKSYEKGKYLLDDYSKVVDENGEPLVVYHGTTNSLKILVPQLIKTRKDGTEYIDKDAMRLVADNYISAHNLFPFTIFDKKEKNHVGTIENFMNFWFSDRLEVANTYANEGRRTYTFEDYYNNIEFNENGDLIEKIDSATILYNLGLKHLRETSKKTEKQLLDIKRKAEEKGWILPYLPSSAHAYKIIASKENLHDLRNHVYDGYSTKNFDGKKTGLDNWKKIIGEILGYRGSFFLNIRSQYNIDYEGATWKQEKNGKKIGDFVSDAFNKGEDGLIIKNIIDSAGPGFEDSANDYVVFSPSQIKSATDNVGTFDSGNVDIRFSVGRPFGGNSGYVGYSKSKRAVDAERRGLRNKSQMDGSFADEVNALIQEKNPGAPKVTLKRIKDALGGMRADEWHHTSMYGNRTDYYSAETVAEYFTPETDAGKTERERVEEKRQEYMRLLSEIEKEVYEAVPYETAEDLAGFLPDGIKLFRTSDGHLVKHTRDVLRPSRSISLIPNGEGGFVDDVDGWTYEHREEYVKAMDEYNAAKRAAVGKVPQEKKDRLFELRDELEKGIRYSVSGDGAAERTAASDLAYNAVRDALANAGIEVAEATEDDVAALKGMVGHIKDTKGTVRGWVGNDGRIYLTKDGMTAETPIHEYTHLWAEALQMDNPELWGQIKELLKGTPEWNRILSSPGYSYLRKRNGEVKDEDRLAGEVLAHISGRENGRRMEAEAKKMIDEAENYAEAAKASLLLGRVRDALKKFWTWVGKTLLGRKGSINIEQVQNMALADLVHGVDPFGPNGRTRRGKRMLVDDNETERVNQKFNDELQQQIDGTLPKGHVYEMGKPSVYLRSTGIPNLPIRLQSSVLNIKINDPAHPFELSEIKDLVKLIQKPIAIFSYGDSKQAQNLMIGLSHPDSEGRKFLVGLSLNPIVKGKELNINSIRTVFPKSFHDWIHWVNQGKLLRVDDKKEFKSIIDALRTNPVDYINVDELDSAANIVENFENPQGEEENFSGVDLSIDGPENHIADEYNRKTGYNGDDVSGYVRNKEELIRSIFDGLRPLEQMQQLIEKSLGRKLRDSEDAYGLATLLPSPYPNSK